MILRRTYLLIAVLATTAWGLETPFHRGVNLTGWLQTSGARQIQFSKFTKADFVHVKSLGCDVIRLPINLHYMIGGAPNYTIDPLLCYFLDRIVDWTEELKIHLILDNHTFDPAINTSNNVGEILVPVWKQMAEHFKDRSELLYYEILNEPHGISDQVWNAIQQWLIREIRTVDTKHTIIVGPAGWNSYYNLALMPHYADTNLIYTFHFYDPFLFTHQGASWSSPSMVSLAGVPFPYDAGRMPACPADLKGSWIEGSLATSYKTDGTAEHVRELIDVAAQFAAQRNVKIFCGEFGVYIPNSPVEDRVGWYDLVRNTLEEKGIAWTIWDYTGGFGLFEKDTPELFDYDLNIPLVQALGLNAPPQSEFVLKPDSTGFVLYNDFIGSNIVESSWASGGLIDFYSETNPLRDRYCIYWTGVPQYANIGFAFKPIKDLSRLVKNGYAIDFWLRGDSPGAKFDIRFIDTKTADPKDHPWRMRMTIDEARVRWDGAWHHLQLPLKNFSEHGSWDNGWFNPQGLFDWAAVDLFEIVSEHHDLHGTQFWYDEIRIVDPQQVSVNERGVNAVSSFELKQNYPNPFNPQTAIRYHLKTSGDVEIAVFNSTGQKVRTLLHLRQSPGEQRVVWDGRDDAGMRMSSGIYFCTMKAGDFVQTRKLVMLD